MKTNICALFILLFPFCLFANTVTALSSGTSPGDWDKSATWSNGRVPQSGDLVLIPVNKAVTIKGVEYTIPPTLTIQVWGTLDFEPSGKLDLSAASSVQLFVGGKITPRNSSSSQLITIGGVIKYNAANNGTVVGPALANFLSGASLAGQPLSGFSFGTPLYVAFASFSGQQTNTGVVLKWETAQELNVDHFEIEESANGSTGWAAVGTIAPKGEPASYSFKGSILLRGTLYFRIKAVYKNAAYDYSYILKLEKNTNKDLLIRPNPSSDFITISFPEYQAGKILIRLINLSGQIVRKLESDGMQGSFQLSVSGVPKGTYFVDTSIDNTERLIKTLVIQ